jgi:hypothetical protein
LVVGQRLDSTGALLGAVFGITPTLDAIDPVVASVSTGSLFFVAWKERFGGLRGRSVDATGSPTQRPVVTISSAVSSTEPDIGRQGLGPACLVVYRTPSGIRIHAVNPSTSFVGPPVTVTSNPNDSAPAILKQSTFFRFLVVWQRLRPADGTHDVLGLAVETGAGHPLILTAEHVIAGETVADEERPVCAGSSDRFLVVYEKQPNGTTGDSDIACRGVSLVETSRWELVISAEAIAAGGSTYDQKHPTVAFAQHQYLVAWSSTGGLAFQNGLYVRGLDLNTCVPCGSPVQFAVSLAGTVNDFPKIGPAVWDQGMIVWQAVSATEGGDIKARLVEAFGTGGAVVDLGGRCGLGGTATVFGPAAIGNGTFRFLLTGASERAAAAAFNLSLPGVPFTCGSCTVTPYFWTVPCGIGGGSSSLLFPIPCEPALIGLTVEAQWTVLLTEQTPCPLSLGASFSNRIHVTVGS